MFKRFIICLIWTAAAVWGGVFIWGSMYAPTVHTGQPRFSVSPVMHVRVHSDDATVSVASCGQFLLWREDTADVIIGTKEGTVPLGIPDCGEYYTYGPKPIGSGNWIVQRGYPMLEFHASHSVTVDAVWNTGDAVLNQIVLTLCLVVLWLFIAFYVILGIRF